MTLKEIIIALTIHLFIPLAGFLYFRQLKNRMKNKNIKDAPTAELFIIFATYGGMMLVALTTLFWKWSGLASLGTFYLIIVAPILMGLIAYRNRENKEKSKYHNWTYKSGLLYFAIAPITFVFLLLASKH
tara:strand:+ start:562 stop:951 length:390 start_codon:yes stop_codon:yes gene_type:complete